MSRREPALSAAAAAASRRNGAASRGPVSAAGKAVSAGNARKHGLFSGEGVSGTVPPTVAAVLDSLGHSGCHPGAWERETARVAALRLSRANELVRQLQAELLAAVLDAALPCDARDELITALLRLQRHARRFRGQRDRALRKDLALSRAVSP